LFNVGLPLSIYSSVLILVMCLDVVAYHNFGCRCHNIILYILSVFNVGLPLANTIDEPKKTIGYECAIYQNNIL
jgi:hypothetical protein